LTLRYAFRGQSDASWDLEPTLLREIRRLNQSEEVKLQVEQRCLQVFKSQAHLHISTNLLSATKDTVSWWTLMQHHGAPTRLLDWSGSLYVAAYFAVAGHGDLPGSVWVAHVGTVISLMKELHDEQDFPRSEEGIMDRFLQPGAPHSLLFVEKRTQTDRMAMQQGLFTISRNILGNHGAILRDVSLNQTNEMHLLRLIIPAKQKKHFLKKLINMNITAKALFPGLDGLGRSVRELLLALE